MKKKQGKTRRERESDAINDGSIRTGTEKRLPSGGASTELGLRKRNVSKKKAAKKKASKKKASKKKASKKKASKKKASKKKASKKKTGNRWAFDQKSGGAMVIPSGYVFDTGSGLIRPDGGSSIVPPNKMKSGIKAAKNKIKETVNELVTILNEDYAISEIEFSVSFNAKGEFLGFGIGGSTTVTIRIQPE